MNGGYPTKRLPPPPAKWAEVLGVFRYIKPEPIYVPWKKQKKSKLKLTIGIATIFALISIGYKYLVN
jgi:hypothetical protein